MTILLTEGFDLVGNSTALVAKGWGVAEGIVSATGSKWSTPCWDFQNSQNNVLALSINDLTSDNYYSVAVWRYVATLPNSTTGYVLMTTRSAVSTTLPAITNIHVGVQYGIGGDLLIYTSGILRATLISKVVAGAWQHFEVRVFQDGTVGTLELLIDGISQYTFTGDTSDGTTPTNLFFSGPSGGTTSLMDDIVISTAPSALPPVLGSHRIQTLLPNGNGTNTAWTGVFTDVDDPYGASDGDTTYASSTTLNAKQDYTFGDLVDTPATIHAVVSVMESRKTDAGAKGVTPFILSSAVEGTGAEVTAAEAYSVKSDIFELDPNGSIAWTATSVNALQAGHEITT